MTTQPITVRTREPDRDGGATGITKKTIPWDASRSAVIICDMWDTHHCISAAHRAAELAPRMNDVVAGLRNQGAMVIHSPSGCMDFYSDYPGRRLALAAPRASAPVRFDWNDRDEDREPPLPPQLADPGPCSCDSLEPCCTAETPYPWTRQFPGIDIHDRDAITDDGQEVYNLLEQRGIADVMIMGVHTNVCVLGRPFGIRQQVYLGKRPLLCRDLTDAFHGPGLGYHEATTLAVEHIERHWCPTLTSDQLVGGVPFGRSPIEDGG